MLACGRDAAGLVYALLDLADRVENGADAVASLDIRKAESERPANVVRSVNRLFTSDVEDKPWFNDREMWPRYLTMLATQRFNRFNLSLGIGYDFVRNVTDSYFLFAYPFLLDVPGYRVRVAGLPDHERDHNLEMLKFISQETVARGLRFQLGIWMHALHVDQQPASELHDCWTDTGTAWSLLPRCCPNVAAGLPGNQRHHIPNSWRERR